MSTPEDREKRIEAAGRAFRHGGWLGRSEIVDMLDAADLAVPVVSRAYVDEHYAERWKLVNRTADLKRAEAAARDFAEAAREVAAIWTKPATVDSATDLDTAIDEMIAALAAHPDFAEPSNPDEEEQ